MLAVVQCNSAQEVRERARITERNRRNAYSLPSKATLEYERRISELSGEVTALTEKCQTLHVESAVLRAKLAELNSDADLPYLIPSIDEIQRAVCKYFNCSRLDLLSRRRTLDITRFRMIAMYLSRTMTMCSLPTIARAFSGRDHTCPLYAFRKIKAQREIDGNLDSTIEAIKSLILTGK